MRTSNVNSNLIPLLLSASTFILYCILGYFFLQKFPDYRFNMSGYDAYLVNIIKDPICHAQATIRHPLFSLFMVPIHFIYNIIQSNYVILCIIAGLTAGANYYMFLILNKIVGTNKAEALVLTVLFISFAYILLMGITPESYPFSLFLLVYSLYIIGNNMQKQIPTKLKQYMILFFLTAGVTVTNGLKVLAGILFEPLTFKKKIIWLISITFAFLIVITPVYVGTKYLIRQSEAKSTISTTEIQTSEKQDLKIEKATAKKVPGFMGFIDFETPYIPAIIHNFIGESIVFHNAELGNRNQNLQNKIILTNYSHPFHNIIAIALFLLAVLSFFISFKNKFVKYLLCFFAVDILLHFVFRFGLNEAYIFAPHWIMIVPILIGFLLKKIPNKARKISICLISILSIYLLGENVYMLSSYLLSI